MPPVSRRDNEDSEFCSRPHKYALVRTCFSFLDILCFSMPFASYSDKIIRLSQLFIFQEMRYISKSTDKIPSVSTGNGLKFSISHSTSHLTNNILASFYLVTNFKTM